MKQVTLEILPSKAQMQVTEALLWCTGRAERDVELESV